MKGRGVAGMVSPRGSVAQWLDDQWGQNPAHSSQMVFSASVPLPVTWVRLPWTSGGEVKRFGVRTGRPPVKSVEAPDEQEGLWVFPFALQELAIVEGSGQDRLSLWE